MIGQLDEMKSMIGLKKFSNFILNFISKNIFILIIIVRIRTQAWPSRTLGTPAP